MDWIDAFLQYKPGPFEAMAVLMFITGTLFLTLVFCKSARRGDDIMEQVRQDMFSAGSHADDTP